MKIIEAPHPHPQNTDIFLGGGISNCPNWQQDVIELLKDVEGVALNPRRTGEFSEEIADEQITWEYYALRTAETVFFWFPEETLCPITLLELGVFTQRKDTRLIVGAHPNYARRFDVIKQLELARPEVVVQDTLEDLVATYLEAVSTGTAEEHARITWAKEDAKYARAKAAVLDELEVLIDKGDVVTLFKTIEENYKDISSRHVRAAFNDLRGSHFYLTSSGDILPPRV